MSLSISLSCQHEETGTSADDLSCLSTSLLAVISPLRYNDRWWKVRVKLSPSDGVAPEDAPTGLVPATYVTPCEPMRQVTALYDYEATSEEEMSIKEDQVYDLYETDGDWTLVGAKDAKEVGYAPTTYLEVGSSTSLRLSGIDSKSSLPSLLRIMPTRRRP